MKDRPRVRLFALDVDGTLLTSDHRVSAATREAVRTVAESGAEIVLASSRGPNGLRPAFEELGMGGLAVAYQGALICRLYLPDGIEVFSEKRLPVISARSVISSAAQRKLSVGWYTAESWNVVQLDDAISREAEITGETPTLAADPVRVREAPHKVLCIAGKPHLLSELLNLASELPEDCAGQFSHENYLEVTHREAGKAPALEALASHLGIAQDEVVAIGDGANDTDMLAWAGVGISMGHAPDDVKMVADWATETNDRDGVAVAVEQLQAQRRL